MFPGFIRYFNLQAAVSFPKQMEIFFTTIAIKSFGTFMQNCTNRMAGYCVRVLFLVTKKPLELFNLEAWRANLVDWEKEDGLLVFAVQL